MRNLEQVRAANALNADPDIRGKKGGDALSGFPALVISNGLLAAIAFSRKQQEGYIKICDSIARHLAHKEIGLLGKTPADAETLLKELTESDSSLLRLCTAEALAYLNYLRRFAKGGGD